MVKYLWITGASIIAILGAIHLYYTFFTEKLTSRDKNTEALMKISHPVLTRKTTIWKAWVGFNASHSLGAMYLGMINLFLATWHMEILTSGLLIPVSTLLFSIFYLYLAARYWFQIPVAGITIATVCFSVAIILILTS